VVFFFGAYEADLKRAPASHAHRALKPEQRTGGMLRQRESNPFRFAASVAAK